MLQKLQTNPILSLSILVILMLGLHLDVLPVSIMEARNFITAREMITDGHWLLTTMNAEARYQKPPLPSWISAGFALVFGLKNVVALRFPTLLFMLLTGIYSFLLSKRLRLTARESFNNALILITSLYVIAIAFEAPSDIFTHGFMMVGIYHLFVLFKDNAYFLKRSLLAGFFIGCSILSKGPVSFYVLLLPFLLAFGAAFRYKFSKKLLLSFIGCLLVALIIGGSWYVYVRLEDPETLMAIAEKETGNWSSYNVRPFYYYWSFFTQSGIWTIPAFVGLLYPYMKSRVSNLKAYKFSFYWTVFAVILLSVIPEKKSRYLMPVLIPLALNTGFYIEYLIGNFKTMRDKWETIPVYFNFGLIALIGLAIPIVGYVALGENLSGQWAWFAIVSLSAVATGVAILLHLKKKQMHQVFYLTVFFFVTLVMFGLPISAALKSEHYKSIAELRADMNAKHIPVYSYNLSPEMLWHYGGQIPPLKDDTGFQFPEDETLALVATKLKEPDLKALEKTYTVEKISYYDLNLPAPNARGYNGRLRADLFLLRKK